MGRLSYSSYPPVDACICLPFMIRGRFLNCVEVAGQTLLLAYAFCWIDWSQIDSREWYDLTVRDHLFEERICELLQERVGRTDMLQDIRTMRAMSCFCVYRAVYERGCPKASKEVSNIEL